MRESLKKKVETKLVEYWMSLIDVHSAKLYKHILSFEEYCFGS